MPNPVHPSLLFIEESAVPDTMGRIGDRPPLGSSVQSFESSLVLIATRRYPHALVLATSAVESVIKAHRGDPPDASVRLYTLLAEIRRRPGLAHLAGAPGSRGRTNGRSAPSRSTGMHLVGDTRNEFVHYGFSPRDDNRAAQLLLDVGLPFLFACYRDLMGFAIRDVMTVEPRLARQLEAAEQASAEVGTEGQNHEFCLDIVGHVVRRTLQPEFLSPWESQAMDAGEPDPFRWGLDEQRLEHAWDPCEYFTCPACDGDRMLCKLDEHLLADERLLQPQQAVCVGCGLTVRSPELLRLVLSDEMASKRAAILPSWQTSIFRA
jgi:hypothetical protein